MSTLEQKLQRLTSDYQDKVKELGNQINKVSVAEQKHYESLQVEAAKRHELVLKDNAIRHEELMRLLKATPSLPMTVLQTHAMSPVPIEHNPREVQGGHIRRLVENRGNGLLPVQPHETKFTEENREVRGVNRNHNNHHTPHPKLEFPCLVEIPDYG